MNNHRRRISAFALVAGLLAIPSQAFAQTDTASEIPDGEIIVTATRTESLASKTPVALTAVSGESLVAAGIKIALITTAAGLLIAIPINVAYNYFVTRIDKLIVEMEQAASTVLNLVWDVFGERTRAVAGAAAGGVPGARRAQSPPRSGDTQGSLASEEGSPERSHLHDPH